MRWVVAGRWSLLASLACQGENWIIAGELPGAASASGVDREMPVPNAFEEDCPSAAQLREQRDQLYGTPGVDPEHVGLWRGSLRGVAAAGFPSGSVELELQASGEGSLRFEAPASTSGVADPERGYLCSADSSGVVCGTASGYVGGYAYPIAGARSRERVLSFVIVPADPWGSWCALREPVAWNDPAAACGQSFGVLPPAEPRWSPLGCSRASEDGAEPIDCALMYALESCQCARDACFAAFTPGIEVGLTLAADAAVLHGSLWYEDEVNASRVELTRVP